jgi:hypothetical protein
MVSWLIDQLFDTTLLWLVAIKFKINTKYAPIVKYKPMLVKEMDKLPSIGASKLNKFLISN